MNNLRLTLAAAVQSMAGAAIPASAQMTDNPFLAPYDTPYEIPPSNVSATTTTCPHSRQASTRNAPKSKDNRQPRAPTFENTIMALENSGEILDKGGHGVLRPRREANSSDELVAIGEDFYPPTQSSTTR